MKYGNAIAGNDFITLQSDRAYTLNVGPSLTESLIVGSVVVSMDGLGVGATDQRVRPFVVAQGDTLSIWTGEEHVVPAGSPQTWYHLPFDMPPRLPVGAVRLGIWAGPGVAARLRGTGGPSGDMFRFVAPYAADAPDLTGAATDLGMLPSAVASGVNPWVPPDNLDDDTIAGLPIDVASGIFGAGGPVASSVPAVCGWYYSVDNPPPPAAAIVREDGPLAELVGQRIRVSARTPHGTASIAVYVSDEQPFDDLVGQDLWITREAFMRIGDLSADAITVSIEILA